MHPTLRQLEYVVALADHLHFGRAARACGVTQPGLSLQVQRLERGLGKTLIERRPSGLLLTGAGREVVSRARRILADVEQLAAVACVDEGPLAGRLHWGVIPTVAPYLLPRILPAVQRAFAGMRPFLHEEKTVPLLDGLRAGRLDLVLCALPLPRPDDGLSASPVLEEEFLLAVPADHRLAVRESVSVDDLAAEEILLLDEGHCLRDQALAICASAGAREQSDFRAASLQTLLQMVRAGVGVTLVPAMMSGAGEGGRARDRRLRLLPFRARPGSPVPRRTIAIVRRSSSPRAQELDHLVEIARRQAEG